MGVNMMFKYGIDLLNIDTVNGITGDKIKATWTATGQKFLTEVAN